MKSTNCIKCGEVLPKRQRLYCSEGCSKLGQKYTNNKYLGIKIRIANKKLQLINLKGGKCLHCGYSRCIQVLSFHHIDNKNKKFNLSTFLLCKNCHGEEHASLDKSPSIEEAQTYQKAKRTYYYKNCKYCQSSFKSLYNHTRFCSHICYSKDKILELPAGITLENIIEESKTSSFTKLGEKYGVSRKRLAKLVKDSIHEKDHHLPYKTYP